MKMKTITKRFLVLFVAIVTMVIGANATPTAYAEYSDSTLTFKYGTMPAGTYVYDVSNTGDKAIQWSSLTSSVKKVVFDASFANARPESCYCWFFGMINLKSIENIEYFNTSSVKYMNNMFFNCSSLTSLDVSGFNTSKVVDMDGMFYNCSSLTKLDVSGFNTSIVSDMSRMFYGCGSIKSLDVSGFNTSRVESMNSMFRGCSALTSLDLSGFDTKKVRNMERMFMLCINLRTIYSNDSWSTQSSTDMFYGCSSLVGAISYNSNKVNVGYANPATGYFTYAPYGLTICGTSITGANYDKISSIDGVSGTVSYDPDHKILTLDNATLSAIGNNTSYAIKSDMPNLKIEVKGNNTLSYTYGGGINSNGSLELSGTDGSSLSVSGPTALVMTSEKENHLIVNDLNLTLDGTSYYGVLSSYSNTVMEIQGNSEVKTKGVRECYSGLKDIIIPEGYEVREPTGAYISGGKVYAADDNTVKNEWVTIGPKGYDLWVGGVQVNVTNCSNISGSNIKQGTVIYNDETKTLTLTDCSIGMDNIAGTVGIKSRMDSLAIHLVGNNGISMVDTGIESTGDVTIAGPGKLNLVFCNTGIYMTEISPNDLLVTDGAKLNMTLVGTGVLGKKMTTRIGNNNVTLYSKNLCVSGGMSDVSIEASTSAISDINKLVLSDGLSLTAPVGAKFASHAVRDKDGNVVKDKNVRISLAGDVNHDGVITMADANAVVNYFLATDKPSDFDKETTDVNGDGGVSMADANQIVNLFLGQ
jgi:surface protein